MPKKDEPKESSDDEEYEIEFILASRMTPSGRKYLVKVRGQKTSDFLAWKWNRNLTFVWAVFLWDFCRKVF